MSEVDELAKVLGGMKAYIDGQIGGMREEFSAALEAHVHAINELQGVVAGLMTEQTLSAAFAGEDYKRFVVEEAARMGVKPSEIIAAKKDITVDPIGSGTGAEMYEEPEDDGAHSTD